MVSLVVSTGAVGIESLATTSGKLRMRKKWIVMLGRAGFAARGGVLVLIDAFLTKAALQYDPDQATGIAGALRALQGTSYGAPLLGVTAVGLACFGLFELGQARRRLPPPSGAPRTACMMTADAPERRARVSDS